MTTFTPEEIKQAQESPRVGDVWFYNDEKIEVAHVYDKTVALRFDDGDVTYLNSRHTFESVMRDATLVNRGPA